MDGAVDKSGAVPGEGVSWQQTTKSSVSEEEKEKDAIVTIVVVVIGVIAVIVILFSMGIFIDYRHRKKNGAGKKGLLLRLKMQPAPAPSTIAYKRNITEDVKFLASNMCPNGNSHLPDARAVDNITTADAPV